MSVPAPVVPPPLTTAIATPLAAAIEAHAEKPFTIGDVKLAVSGQARSAMVITPKMPMVIDRARLDRSGKSSSLSPVESWLVEQARLRGSGAKVLLFRAANAANERVWEFDRTFNEKDLQEAGVIMTRALLPLHRALLASGVVLMVHTDWGRRESLAMRHGVQALTQELMRADKGNAARRVDAWILRNMLMHVALSLDHVVQKLLPAQMRLIERRWSRVLELLDMAVEPRTDRREGSK